MLESKLYSLAFILTLSLFVQTAMAKNHRKGGPITPAEAKVFFQPLPDSLIDKDKFRDLISLGRKLYLDKRLSINNKISCNSCHQLDKFGVDGLATSPGHDGRKGDRNSPTSFNSGLNFRQFWDGRAKDLEEQATGPVLNPIEMGMPNKKAVEKKLSKIKEYPRLFKKAFPKTKKALTLKNIGIAIAAFEKTLMTPSRFDQFLKGDGNALTFQEKRGLRKFVNKGCVACHSGPLLGGKMYQKLGSVVPYPTKDLGRFNVTKNEGDKYFFKVPTLRNIEKTGPYFHNGEVSTLEEAIQLMAKHQLGSQVGPGFIEDVKAFLSSLTSEAQF